MKKFEYTVKVYSTDELKDKGIYLSEQQDITYACQSDGTCEIVGASMRQVDKFSKIFNEMGLSGWELVQIFFHSSGLVTIWKRELES